jgi:hypothetical protein
VVADSEVRQVEGGESWTEEGGEARAVEGGDSLTMEGSDSRAVLATEGDNVVGILETSIWR